MYLSKWNKYLWFCPQFSCNFLLTVGNLCTVGTSGIEYETKKAGQECVVNVFNCLLRSCSFFNYPLDQLDIYVDSIILLHWAIAL